MRRYSVTRAVRVLLVLLVLLAGASVAVGYLKLRQHHGRWTLWQIPPVSVRQAMSYVIRTGKGRLIVVDGGWEDDGPPLAAFIGAHGGSVAAWFITHPHPDHVGALTNILGTAQRPAIDVVYASLPTDDFVRKHEPIYLLPLLKFRSALAASGQRLQEVRPGENLAIDDLRIEILAARNPEIQVNAINNSSVVFRVDGRKSILFLGDLGLEGGRKLMAGPYRSRLHVDYVQMAHHGQAGVDEDFYRAVAPSCCLWPTPGWLWFNNSGDGPNTGPWKTLETREWMNQLGVKRHIVSMDGVAEIDE